MGGISLPKGSLAAVCDLNWYDCVANLIQKSLRVSQVARLLAEIGPFARRHIDMEMVEVGVIGLRTERGAEYPAG